MGLYEEAWNQLYRVFGEQLKDEELEIMESVLTAVKLEREEEECTNTSPK